jgi:hypothetical protein
MEPAFSAEVATTAEGLTTIQIRDRTGGHPTLRLFERSDAEKVVWVGTDACAVPLCQEQVWEALPYLLTFLDAGRLVKR